MHQRAPTIIDEGLRLSGSPRATWGLGLAGAAALGGGLLLGWRENDGLAHFYHAYLTSYAFLLSLALGGLFFVLLQHVSRAGWSVVVRRLAELLAGTLPMLAVLFLPLAAAVIGGNPQLYPWSNARAVEADELLQHKAVWLNASFFLVRAAAYCAVWIWLGRFYLRRSLAQDGSRDPGLTRAMERASPLGLILFAITLTLAAFDWLMSLEPRWFSTIFGVYYFSGAVVGALAAMILGAVLLQAGGRLRAVIRPDHYHDLGKLLLAFVVFWGYIAFSQYMLIWYANLPEETVWFRPRSEGPWGQVSLVLLAGNLLLPFLGLLSRSVKRRKMILALWAAWLLAMHWLDMAWLVMPSLDPAHIPLGWLDAACLAGLGGLWIASLLAVAGRHPLVPLGDPRLNESLTFENV